MSFPFSDPLKVRVTEAVKAMDELEDFLKEWGKPPPEPPTSTADMPWVGKKTR